MAEIVIHFQGKRSHQMMTLTEYVYDEHYDRYQKRIFPIECRGQIEICLNDKNELHREGNLPSWKSILTGYSEYRVNGKLHRTDGPAIDDEYWFKGVKYDKGEWQKLVDEHNKLRPYFLREKIICLQKLIEIPELYQEVYYRHKKEIMALMKKL